jgi:hypothetical protein
MKTKLIIFLFSVFYISLFSNNVIIDGFINLENETDFSGVFIQFNRTIPNPLEYTDTTDKNGYFNITIEEGIYSITIMKEGYIPQILEEQMFYFDTTYSTITLETIGLSGQLNGVLVSDVYNVGGDIEVNIDDTLIIMEGTILKFCENVKFNINGLLIANGSETDSIIFTANNISKPWTGIKFSSSSNNNSCLSFCKVSYCDDGAIEINNSGPSISNSTISYNYFYSDGQESGAAGIHLINSNSIIKKVEIYNNELKYISYFSSYYHRGAGGVACRGGSPTLINLSIHNNTSEDDCCGAGGIVCNDNSQLTLTNCIIYSNIGRYGGGLGCQTSGLKIYNSTIVKNNAISGGGIYISVSDPEIINSIITENMASSSGHEIYFGCSVSTTPNPSIQFCNFGLLEDSDVAAESSCGETIPYFLQNITTNINGDNCDPYYNIALSPDFIDITNDDFELDSNSPCIDAGSNSYITIDYDYNYNIRIWQGNIDSIVDIGAYEYNSVPYTNIENAITQNIELFKVFPNPFSEYMTLDHIKSDIKQIDFCNIQGGSIFSYKNLDEFNNTNFGFLTPGIYIIKLETNYAILHKKVIKK